MEGKIHSFESFGTVDGPGIRFVIFFKGCPLRCLYCHNPDTWTFENSKTYSEDEIIKEALKYKGYWGEKGGVTITGGEPTLQLDFLISLLKKFKEYNVHTAVDTCGYLFNENNKDKYLELIKYTDLFLLDIKHINNEEHIKLTSKENKSILNFAKFLSDNNKSMWIRHVLVPTITDNDSYLYQLKEFIESLKTVEKVEVLPYHTLGVNKYKMLNIKYPLEGINSPSKERVMNAKNILEVKKYAAKY